MRAAEHQAFAAALCAADAALPAGLHAPRGTSLADRFAIYRNNVHVSLVDALAQAFPVVCAQLGDEFFRSMARLYVQRHKPGSAILTSYGMDLPDFIAEFEPAAALPWLPDLARLECAWSECWAAADAAALPITALRGIAAAELAGACITVHPAARLVSSPWPVASLWEAHQCPGPADLSTLQWQPQHVLLTRPQAAVLLRQLDAAGAQFTAALIAGKTIEAAAATSPGANAGQLLGQLLVDGMILEIHR